MTILYLSLAATTLLFTGWLVKHRNRVQEAAERWWRGMNDKEAYWPAFIIALVAWGIWVDVFSLYFNWN